MILPDVIVVVIGAAVVVGVVPVGRVDLGVMLMPCIVTGNPVVLCSVVEGEGVVAVESTKVVPFVNNALVVKVDGIVGVRSSNVVLVDVALLFVVVSSIVESGVEDVFVIKSRMVVDIVSGTGVVVD